MERFRLCSPDFEIQDGAELSPLGGTLRSNNFPTASFRKPNESSPTARGHHYTLNRAIVSHFLCLIDPTATQQCVVATAEPAACLGVRHAICNYIVVFLNYWPSVDSRQCTCWSAARGQGLTGAFLPVPSPRLQSHGPASTRGL